jgi:hypothetical protein
MRGPSRGLSRESGDLVEWVEPESIRNLYLKYPDLTPEDIAWARRTVEAMPPISRATWERIARTLGLEIAEDGRQPLSDGQADSVGRLDQDPAEEITDD